MISSIGAGPRLKGQTLATVYSKNDLAAAHGPRWFETAAMLAFPVAYFSLAGVMVYGLVNGWPAWVIAAMVIVASHLMHSCVLILHEAVHFNFAPHRGLNDALGLFLGTFSFVSPSLYRAIHGPHHSAQSTQRDEEMWPFNDPQQPRWKRRLCAVIELAFGTFWTPALFFRAFIRRGTVMTSPVLRRRIWMELAVMAVVWTAVLGVVFWMNWQWYFLIAFFIPSCLTGIMQSMRKYVEHMGLTSPNPSALTRTVDAHGLWGRILSYTLLHEPYHGVHHRYGRLRHSELPRFAGMLAKVDEANPEQQLMFPSYTAAFIDMMQSLRDPKAGPQWLSQ